MDSATSTIHHLPESILTEILARLPLRSNSRLKTVSKTVKATLESVYFRRIFVSLHKNSSSSWSLGSREGDELIGFHGCKTWDVPKSLGSFISLPLGFEFKASSNGLVLIERYGCGYSYVGNPVLQQWVKIPQLPFLAHDFFSDSDQFMVVHLPEHSNHNNNGVVNGALTTSGGFVMYMKSLVQKRGTVLKVWRLNHDQSWQLLCEINGLSISGSFVPIAMHPFDSDIVYRWHQESPRHLVSCNLRTETLIDPAREYHGDFYMNQSGFEEYMDEIGRLRASDRDYTILIGLFQSVLPRWMESVPRPPQVDMIDTTSLPSYVACCLIEQDE
ncbi:hypothetical protein Bca101_086343 [Brassica carinata]